MKIRKHSFSVQTSRDINFLPTRPFIQDWLSSYCALVGDAEDYIVRTASRSKTNIQCPKLREDLKFCFGQEGQHAITHRKFVKQLKVSKLSMEAFLNWNKKFNYEILGRFLPQSFQLAAIAGMEQMNTTIAYEGLKMGWLQDCKDPEIKSMLHWHFIEEIEHRTVIFDLMKAKGTSALFVAPASLLTWSSFVTWISLGAFLLGLQKKSILSFKWWTEGFLYLWGPKGLGWSMLRSAMKMNAKDYHPSQDPLPKHSSSETLALGSLAKTAQKGLLA